MRDECRQYVMDAEVGNNFVELLGRRARKYSDKIAVTFLLDGELTERSLTYAQLDLRSRAIAVRLLAEVLPGDRVLLLQPPGLEFVIAFFGCLYAGVVAVAAYPPRNARHMSRIEAMLEDAQARTILTSEEARTKIEPWLGDRMVRFRLICSEKIGTAGADAWQMPVLRSDTLALLQYTSGSTGEPRGVMVSHGNIMANEEMIRKTFGHHSQSSFASWLPIYHDMGLIGNLLQPLYIGTSTVLMPPASFLQKPVRWLSAISRFRARVTGAPNFAFDLCARAVTEEQKASLDLSCLELLYSGSEPIDARSLDRFATTFRDCGLRREALYPCYGMAEATLLCTGGRPGAGPRYLEIDAEALASGHNQPANGSTRKRLTVVSCGESVPGQDLHIVEPSSRVVMRDGLVGEIWLRGAHITAGYWRNEADTRELCNARLASDDGRFLRTGDLGFVHLGELYVTGRIKDVIITRGCNHYPQDIERTVEVSHPALQPNSCAAFAVTVEGTEQLAIAVELRRAALKSLDSAAVIGAIRSAVMEIHELAVCAVALLKPLTLPKTSSGKLQRGACRALFLDGRLAAIAEWRQNHTLPVPTPMPLENTPKSCEAIRGWLVRELASRINSPIEALDVHAPFSSHGLDSVASVQLTTALENWLGRKLSPTLVYDYRSIDALSLHLGATCETPATEDCGTCCPDPGDEAISKLETVTRAKTEPIALIGIGCRFPGGASDPDSFWKILHTGVDAIRQVPSNRWKGYAYYDPEAKGQIAINEGGFLDEVDQFDAHYFGISPREAASMDPQHRLLLEVTVEALENAGCMPNRLAENRIGVFVGITNSDYGRLLHGLDDPALFDGYYVTGNLSSTAAGRLSYTLGLIGPSIAIDTACSSSLVAVHLACQSLRTGECDLTIAAGVNLILSPDASIALSRAQMLSPDGRCKAFDAAADGYGRGEGCGVVVLKRLSAALKDKDHILAVIRASGVNQDGPSGGFTVPSGLSQEKVIRRALDIASLEPADISYVEAHGTGTPLGDPIEVGALARALGQGHSPDNPLLVGTVKTNIGHLESAAGIAGLIKVVLALQNSELPALANFRKPNPHIPWNEVPIRTVSERIAWPRSDKARRAGVSSFGISGTNAHLIVEEAPALNSVAVETAGTWDVLTLSAKSKEALQELTARFEAHLTAYPQPSFGDVCFTANTGRAHHQYRLSVPAFDLHEAARVLRSFRNGIPVAGTFVGEFTAEPTVALLFSGEDFNCSEMGRALYDTQPPFRKTFDECAQIVRNRLEVSLSDILDRESKSHSPPDKHSLSHVAMFSFEYALAKLWIAWGINPAGVIGLGRGEYAAACVAGVLSLEDAVNLCIGHTQLLRNPGDFVRLVNGMSFSTPAMRYVSGLTGGSVATEIAAPEYWVRQVNQVARLAEIADAVAEFGLRIVLALNPHTELAATLQANPERDQTFVPSVDREGDPKARSVFESLAALYARGATIRWEAVNQNAPRKRIPLPTNPWRRRRYGFNRSDSAGETPSQKLSPIIERLLEGKSEEIAWELEKNNRFSDAERKLLPRVLDGLIAEHRWQQSASSIRGWLYEVKWQTGPQWKALLRQDGPDQIGTTSALGLGDFYPITKQASTGADANEASSRAMGGKPGHWIVFADREGLAEELAVVLERRGDSCSLITKGKSYEASELGPIRIAPDRLTDFQQLFAKVRPPRIKGILYLWSIDCDAKPDPTAFDGAAHMEEACHSFLYMVQSLLGAGLTPVPTLTLITRGAMAVTGSAEKNGLVQSGMWGITRILALEHPEYKPAALDLDPHTQPDEPEAIAAEISEENREPAVAFRAGERYLARLAQYFPAEPPVRAALAPDATYLISGGLGGLGLTVAEWMISSGARHLVLASRGKPDPLTAEKLRHLGQTGTRITLVQVDVSIRADVAHVLEQIESSGIPLRGIVHAAGVLEDGMLVQLSWERFRRVLRPKVAGAWHLHTLTQKDRLEFFVLFSSVASLIGAPGQANYVAANTFLDALAHHRRSQGLPALSINWGPWADVGMAARHDVVERAKAKGIDLIPPRQGLEALELLLSQRAAQVSVVPIAWEQFRSTVARQPFFSALAGTATEALESRNNFLMEFQMASPVRQKILLQDYIRSQAMKVLGVDTTAEIDLEQDMLSGGMDSLASTELRNNLQASLGIQLPSTLVYDCPTIGGIAELLFSRLTSPSAISKESEPVLGQVGDTPNLDSLSEHELGALLDEELRNFDALRQNDGDITTESGR
jgi:acyl transferase domain-containing protein/acyl-CoA synthetase (AMP-forming)/AMP-acid ligase II/acyl carrier protein